MESARKRIKKCQQQLIEIDRKLNIKGLLKQLDEYNAQIANADFWKNPVAAADISKKQAELDSQVRPWIDLEQSLVDLNELLSFNDDSMLEEINQQVEDVEQRILKLQKELRFKGPYDRRHAILSIHAGAGGTDAQDWAAMLLRMYLRWAEQNGLKATVIEESPGEEAGIKSATIQIAGNLAYGKLKNEHGVHRLVRLSPFNADSLRQTSFAKVEVLPKIDQPDEVQIDEKDLKVDVYRSGGHGGQSVNTTDSAVRVTHLPTGIVVAIQNERSQLQNKETAMTILRSKLAQLQHEQHLESLAGIKGPNEQAAWGNQIRNYVLHPYKQVKDMRSKYESSDPESVLNGGLNDFIESLLDS